MVMCIQIFNGYFDFYFGYSVILLFIYECIYFTINIRDKFSDDDSFIIVYFLMLNYFYFFVIDVYKLNVVLQVYV